MPVSLAMLLAPWRLRARGWRGVDAALAGRGDPARRDAAAPDAVPAHRRPGSVTAIIRTAPSSAVVAPEYSQSDGIAEVVMQEPGPEDVDRQQQSGGPDEHADHDREGLSGTGRLVVTNCACVCGSTRVKEGPAGGVEYQPGGAWPGNSWRSGCARCDRTVLETMTPTSAGRSVGSDHHSVLPSGSVCAERTSKRRTYGDVQTAQSGPNQGNCLRLATVSWHIMTCWRRLFPIARQSRKSPRRRRLRSSPGRRRRRPDRRSRRPRRPLRPWRC